MRYLPTLAVTCILATLPVAMPTTAQAMANPAAVFCARMGGRSVIATVSDGGQVGLCYLPGKKIVEEWTLLRMFNGNVPTRHNNPFRQS